MIPDFIDTFNDVLPTIEAQKNETSVFVDFTDESEKSDNGQNIMERRSDMIPDCNDTFNDVLPTIEAQENETLIFC